MAFRSLLNTRNSLSPLLRHPFTVDSFRMLVSVSPSLRRLSTDSTAGTSVTEEEVRVPRNPPRFGKDRNDAQSLNAEMLLPGCDFKHWLVFMEPPKEDTPRDAIIDRYVKTLAEVVGRLSNSSNAPAPLALAKKEETVYPFEEEAKMKIYSVSTRHYYAFGCLISQEVSDKLKSLPGIHWVLPDSYLHPKEKDYGGEPFINGKAVPYDPKYHAVWLQNNQRPPPRSKRMDRDRPRNFDRARDNWSSRDSQNRPPRPPFSNQNHEAENHPVRPAPCQAESQR